MKRYLWTTFFVGLMLATTASATMMRQEWWTGVGASRQAIIDFLGNLANPTPKPDAEVIQNTSDYPGNVRDNYVAKFYGWVTVPETGTYQFHYACDDYGMLYVSQDEEMANAVEVAYVDGWCSIDQWTKYASQHSAPMELQKGQIMAVMAFFQEAGGGDNMDLGWTGPGISSDIANPTYLTNYITHIPPTPAKAKSPGPETDAVDVPLDAALSWANGKFAASHDVYLGTVLADVNNASRTDPRGVLISQDQAAATFDLKGVTEYGKTYYWRIDEVNAPPSSTTFKGKVWTFTAEPFAYPITGITATASSSQPSMGPENTLNGSGLTGDLHGTETTTMWMSKGELPNWVQYDFDKAYKLDKLLVWNSNQMIEAFIGFGAKDVTVEYSVDGATWTALADVPPFSQGTGLPDYAANTTVSFGGVMAKSVKLTINQNWGGMATQTGFSEVRFLYVPVQAFGPQPTVAATGVSINTDLNWRSGREAESHVVYLGADQNALAQVGAPAEHSLTPASLNFGTTYYWKVNEVGGAGPYEGQVWSFATQEYLPVDDFEAYNDDDNRIYDSWIDGLTDSAKGGSQVGYDVSPFAEKTIVHGGLQAMPFEYNNVKAPYYSEAERTFASPQNWTANGADTLSLYFRGRAVDFADNGNNTFTMSASGTDIWNSGDEFRFAYKSLNGNGSITALVDSIVNTNVWAKACVMIRETLDAGSKHASTAATAANSCSFQHRDTTSAAAASTDWTGTAVTTPYWVRITRTGNVFKCETSPDGKTWTQLGPDTTITMGTSVYLGLAVTSHDAALTTVAAFSNVSTTGAVTGSWQAVAIGATMPTNGPAPLYLTVQDKAGKTKTLVNPNPSASATGAWTEWRIPLSSLTGVSLTTVQTITLGVGDKTSPKAGPAGMLYLDDIGFGHPAAQ
ncbi:MAG: discoidin domain-containing protein [Phycisphaerae bacterium]|nr:discoidin domain-containing protein [Phycisphaerae bacterium]